MEFVRTLKQVQMSEPETYGQRACDLSLLVNERIPAPATFVLTTKAWEYFVKKNNIQYKIDFILKQVDMSNERTISSAYNSVRRLILNQSVPDEILSELKDAYESLGGGFGLDEMMKQDTSPYVLMLASPTYPCEAESFEGIIQNVSGMEQLVLALKEIYAMNFTADALNYRKRIGQKDFGCAIIFQSMPQSIASATAYSTDPEHQELVFVHAYKGFTDLRDIVAKDFFHVKKEFLNVVSSQIVEQTRVIVRNEDGHLTPEEFSSKDQSLNDKEVMEVGRLAKKSEKALASPVKLFVSVDQKNNFYLLFANRYAVPQKQQIGQEPQRVVKKEEEPMFKQDAATGAVVAAGASQAASVQQEPVVDDAQEVVVEEHDKYDSEDDDAEDAQEYYEEGVEKPRPKEDGLVEEPEEDKAEEFVSDDLLGAAADEEFDEETQEFADTNDSLEDEDTSDEFLDEYERDDSEEDTPEDDSKEEPVSEEVVQEPEGDVQEDDDDEVFDEYEEDDQESVDEQEDDDEYDREEPEGDEEFEYEDDEHEGSQEDSFEEEPASKESVESSKEDGIEDDQEDEPVPKENDLVEERAEDEGAVDDQEGVRDLLNKSFRIIYAELSKEYAKGGEQAPDTITELVQQGVQKQLFHVDGLSEVLVIKRKLRTDDPITEEEKALVLRVLNELVE